MNDEKFLEELKLDLIEVQAYRDLQDEGFSFDGINTIRNDSKYSQDAYYKMLEQSIKEAIQEIEDRKLENKKKVKRIDI